LSWLPKQQQGHHLSRQIPRPIATSNFPYGPADWAALWGLLEQVFRAGEAFPHEPTITEAEARMAWVDLNQAMMVAVDMVERWWARIT
jgi:hypothetical protein